MQSSEISRALESWYARHRGDELCDSFRARLQPVLDLAFGYHILQLGPLPARNLIANSPINHRILAAASAGGAGLERPGGPPGASGAPTMLCHGDELPLESDSMDMIVAFHALEFDQHPHGCLREMQRVLRPHGHLIVVGFNPNSLLGLALYLRRGERRGLWRHHRPVSLHRLTDWLRLLDCELETIDHLYPVPLVGRGRLRRAVESIDTWAMRHALPGGGLYIAHAIKQIPGARRPSPLRLPARKPRTGLAVAGSGRAAPEQVAARIRGAASEQGQMTLRGH